MHMQHVGQGTLMLESLLWLMNPNPLGLGQHDQESQDGQPKNEACEALTVDDVYDRMLAQEEEKKRTAEEKSC